MDVGGSSKALKRKSGAIGDANVKMIKKKENLFLQLDSLPEEVLVTISSICASSCLSTIRSLRLVSKSFQKICDNKSIISRLSLQEIPFFPWNHDLERFSNFHKRCRRCENPEALYREGFINYFIENKKENGLKLLAKVVEKENKEAMYVYGMILLCLERSNVRLNTLAGLMKPLLSKTVRELVKLRNEIRGNVLWRGKSVMEDLKRSYVQKNCA